LRYCLIENYVKGKNEKESFERRREMKEVTGNLNAGGMKMAIVVSRFNSFFTEQLVKGAEDCFVRHGGKDADLLLVRVPGANEIPQVAQKLATSGTYSAIIALGPRGNASC
jgi:6,7-dimethyl-8-ribityllumazine synthase